MPAERSRPWALWATLAAVGTFRLLQMRTGSSPDEGGFLVVAAQWHSGGTTLYGHYWVDRPPVLITIFALAHLLGGLVALRVLGMIAALTVITLLHSTARRVYGDAPARWAAVVGGALMITPLYGAIDVNGELFALVFVAVGIRCAVASVFTADAGLARAAAVGAGAAAVAAVLTKQNFADVVVFASVCWVLAWRTGRMTGARLLSLIGYAATGAVLAYGAVMLWALAHGTSPAAVYEATYPFRLKASAVIAQESATQSTVRLGALGRAFALSMVPVVLVAAAACAVRRPKDLAVLGGLIALVAYGAFSVLAGGNYWLHYLMETVAVASLAAAALAASAPRVVRPVAALVALSALVAGTVVIFNPAPTGGWSVGDAIGRSAEPGDTIVSAFGDANIVLASGLSSPYEYLWSLPAHVRDPHLMGLRQVLAGPSAPTWFVVRDRITADELAHHGVLRIVKDRYRAVGTVCGRTIYLLDSIDRNAPQAIARDTCT